MWTGENEQIAFYLQLLMRTMDFSHYPFTKLIIESGVGKKAYDELLEKLHELQQQFEYQKEEGLLNYASLLQEFTAQLPPQLKEKETLKALRAENMYPVLMDEFLQIMEDNDGSLSRLRSRRRKRDRRRRQ